MLLTAEGEELTGCRWAANTVAGENCNPTEREKETLETAVKQIEEYFEGKRKFFSIRIRLQGTPFRMKVWEELLKIPYGETITYKELAYRIGSPDACRAAANACGANRLPVIIPCHRVVASGGRSGGYTGPEGMKQYLLSIELCHKQDDPV